MEVQAITELLYSLALRPIACRLENRTSPTPLGEPRPPEICSGEVLLPPSKSPSERKKKNIDFFSS